MVTPAQFTAHFEGYHARAYRDAGGWSIGYGHWSKRRPYGIISRAQAMRLLKADLKHVQSEISRTDGGRRLTAGQTIALDDFAYNVGIGAWLHSTLRRDIILGRFTQAARQFSRWVYSRGRVLPGLVARRRAEEKMFGK